MRVWFCVAGVAVLEGPMYAVGGHDGWSYLSTVERYEGPSHRCFIPERFADI